MLYSKTQRINYKYLIRLVIGSVLAVSFSLSFISNADAEVAVVVNLGVVVDEVTQDDIANVFLKRVKNLPNGIQLTPIDQKDSLQLKQEFYLKVTGKNPNQLNAYWSRLVFTGKGAPPQTVRNDDEVIRAVRANPELIGYIDASKVDETVKVLFSK